MRRDLIALLFLASLVAGCGIGGSGKRLNLLVITIDTLRRDAVGCYGAPDARTPAFDRLAREGILFANAASQVPITLPSHATLFTGRYPDMHGTRHNGTALREEETTLAERLQARGYTTAAFIGSAILSSSFRMGQGFETYEDSWKGGERGLHGLQERKADAVADSFIKWFEQRDQNKPFFAWVHLYDPHSPHDPPSPFDRIAGGGYAGEVSFADRELGRVLDALHRAGLDGETVVVLLSDHGEGLREHDETEHGIVLYETTLSIPWVLRAPGGPRGAVAAAPVETIDLLPTLASLLGMEKDASWLGRDLLALPGAGAPEEAGGGRPLFSETLYGTIGYGWAPLHAVRRGDWKLVRGNWDDLYDLASDPGETVNRAGENRGIVDELGALLAPRSKADSLSSLPAPDLTKEERAMLEALGYAAPSASPPRGADRPDPREVLPAHELIVQSVIHAAEGKGDLARQNLIEAIGIDPKNLDALIRLARYYRESGELEKERGLYDTILSIDPCHPPAWNNLAVLAQIGGDPAEAERCIGQALQCDSNFADAYVNRGNLLTAQGKLDEAVRSFDHALRLDPRSGVAHYGKALVHEKRGEFEGVVEELKIAIHIDPNLRQARDWLRALERSTQPGI